MQSNMTNRFAQVPQARIPRASFNRDSAYKTTFDAGNLVPFYWDVAYPGDTFKLRANMFARLNTPVYPVMDNMSLSTYFFEVPIRQIWDNARRFFGERINPDDSIDYTVPTITSPAGGYTDESIYDYLGCRKGIAGIQHSALPLRAAYHCYNEWFRDQNLQDSLTFNTNDGPDDPADYTLFKRNKRHDYFTSCLPWPQKGEAVELPLGTRADIATDVAAQGNEYTIYSTSLSGYRYQDSSVTTLRLGASGGTAANAMYADLSTATAATINQWRQALQIQALLERDARGGTRFPEIIRNHFGVDFFDQSYRPIYLGGGKSYVNFNAIAQTSSTDATTPQGNLAAMATVGVSGHGFTKSFNEWSIVIGFLCVDADLTYQQGMNREWFDSTRYDFYWPELARLGEQAVLNREIYTQGTAEDTDVFGYQEMYGHLRYKPSKITGKLTSDATGSLHVRHLSQNFSALPTLGDTFISEDPPVDRVVATTTEPDFTLDSYLDLQCIRPMPLYGIPASLGRF